MMEFLSQDMEHENYCLLMQDLEDVVTCQVCFHRMEKPKMLSCLHSFCLVCISDMPVKENGLLHCPICREKTLVQKRDPRMLPTTFLINQLSDIIIKHERLTNQIEESVRYKTSHNNNNHYANIHGCITKQQTTLNVLANEMPSTCVSSKAEPLQTPMRKKNASFMTQLKTVGGEETTKSTRYFVQIEKPSSCQNDKHIFVVKEMREEYIEGDKIQLKLWKFCNNNTATPCYAWADKVDGTLVHNSGRIINFNTARLSDGGWLLSCHANCSGTFRVIIKMNNKPVKTMELKVEACK